MSNEFTPEIHFLAGNMAARNVKDTFDDFLAKLEQIFNESKNLDL